MAKKDSPVAVAETAEKEIVVAAKQRKIFDELHAAIDTLTQRLNIVFATICAGHDGLENARFVRWGEGKDGVHTLIVSVPKE